MGFKSGQKNMAITLWGVVRYWLFDYAKEQDGNKKGKPVKEAEG